MKTRHVNGMGLGLLVLVGLLSGGGCLPQPKQSYTIEQIGQIQSLKEIMRVQAATMDPLFKKRGQTAFSPEEFAALAEAGHRIQATSATVIDRFAAKRQSGFGTFAGKLNAQAGDLAAAAEAKDDLKSAETLRAMKQTCSGCHREFR